MKEYQVQIKEVLAMTVTVNAENAAQAREIVEKRYNDCDYILDADHFKGVDIHRRPASKGAQNGTMNRPTAPAAESTTFRNTLYQQATCLYSHRHSLSGEIP